MSSHWSQHLGTVDLIWADGYTMTKPIGSLIRGLTRTMDSGKVERYVDYKLNISDHVAESLNAVEVEKFMKWINIVNHGLERGSWDKMKYVAWDGASEAWREVGGEH